MANNLEERVKDAEKLPIQVCRQLVHYCTGACGGLRDKRAFLLMFVKCCKLN